MQTASGVGATMAGAIAGESAADAARAGELPDGTGGTSEMGPSVVPHRESQGPDDDPIAMPDADEASDHDLPPSDQRAPHEPITPEPMLETAIERLTQVALQMDDPVQALEDGIDALAEALALREMDIRQAAEAVQAQQRRRQEAQAELGNAYRHARLQRVGELVDVGYSLDQAVAITNANEAEIRRRALSVGRDPDQVIYDYAVRHGYRPASIGSTGHMRPSASAASSRAAVQPGSVLERLAALPDDEFARATQGDRWERLLRHG